MATTSSSSGMMLGVYDGFLPLEHDSFSSLTKCGGRAAFHPALSTDAHALHTQIEEWTRCRSCGDQMFLLAQAFAPLPTAAHMGDAHNRMMYVYACNSAVCAAKASDSWVSFSVQLDKDDEAAAVADDDADDAPVPVEPTPKELIPAFTYPPLSVDVVPEPQKEVIVPTDVEAELIRATEASAAGPADAEDIKELEDQLDLKDKPIDVYFDKFRRRVARCPKQVLRYQWGGLPLFMNVTKTFDLSVPACEHCGGVRAMELQLLPTLLFFVRSKDYVTAGKRDGDDGLDFATATVYTCAAGCLGKVSGLVAQREFLFVEPAPTMAEEISPDGKPDLRSYFAAPPS